MDGAVIEAYLSCENPLSSSESAASGSFSACNFSFVSSSETTLLFDLARAAVYAINNAFSRHAGDVGLHTGSEVIAMCYAIWSK